MEFFNDWERGVSGSVGREGVHHVLNDFAIKITSLVKAGQHTGYMAEVKREHDGSVRCGIHWIMI